MRLMNIITLHSTDFDILWQHGTIPSSHTLWMFRAVDDENVEHIKYNKGFMFPNANRAYIYGCGGIGFTPSLQHVFSYAKKRTQAFTHIFAVPLPTSYYVVDWKDLPIRDISTNLYIQSVRNGESIGDEFIVSQKQNGNNQIYSPSCVLWLKLV